MKRDVSLYLADIVQNMDDAMEYVKGMTYDQFVKDSRTVKAVVRSIEIIGEASKHVPEEMRAKSPGVPWKNMAGMRDKCIHDHSGVDHETVWYAVKDDIPDLRRKIADLAEKVRAGKNQNENRRSVQTNHSNLQ
jgi:uncharacterized protein with HEPN domain